jgi:glycosyltransferase involved in cell wall biosynthesis
MAKEKLSVIIPVYNEAASIDSVVRQLAATLKGWPHQVIVVDDASADGGCTKLKGVKLVSHSRRRGYGAAIKTGLRNSDGELVAIIDGDGSYPVADLPRLAAAMDGVDMVVGARPRRGRAVPLVRRPAKFVLNLLANYLSGVRIPDINSGLRLFRRADVKPFLNILPDGFSLTMTITLSYLCAGLEVSFLPIKYFVRQGKSKIRPIRDTANFLLLLARTAMLFNPLRVFLPVSLLLLLAGTGEVLYYYYALQVLNVSTSALVFIISALLTVMLGLLADLIVRKN